MNAVNLQRIVACALLSGCLLVGDWSWRLHADDSSEPVSRHWSFQPLSRPALPTLNQMHRVHSPIDRFVQAKLEEQRLSANAYADKATLLRRVTFDLIGLPPSPDERSDFLADDSPAALERVVDRLLASPHFGEHWGKWWLDAVGYADSNGYFSADTDRPLAYRYRDYVVRSLNADKPFDQFVREQLAGDELSGFDPQRHERHASPEMIEQLEATHFLRNGPDGSGESDGNPEEVMIDRYYALESAQQVLASSLLGLTIQCAKCHDHKFEPITQREYYQLQAFLFPVFNMQQWIKPNERFVHVNVPGEMEAWESRQKEAESLIAARRAEFSRWVQRNRPSSAVLFSDDFEGPESSFAQNWSNTAPGDDAPGGVTAVTLATSATSATPAAERINGTLRIIEGGPSGDKWVSTTQAFDWTPNQPGEWIQVTFDVLDNKVGQDGKAAERIAFFIATHDFNDSTNKAGGNILLDGNPAGGAAVYLDYPGSDMKQVGAVGTSGFVPGRNFGVRVTNLDNSKFRLEQVVDWLPEEKSITLTAADLPDGGFGFEFCCGRSFVVDNVVIESSAGKGSDESAQAALKAFRTEYESRRKSLSDAVTELQKQKSSRPGRIAWASDVSVTPPKVPLLIRGNVATPGELVQPSPLKVLARRDSSNTRESLIAPTVRTTGRRTALADWITHRDSPAAALSARVQVNRVWQRLFGRGLVATAENLGVSGAEPSHLELLEWLASEFLRPTGSADSASVHESLRLKRLIRGIVTSAAYQRSSQFNEASFVIDPDNRWLWRRSVRRLDAESIRDAMRFASGHLDRRMGGPYVPTQRTSAAEVIVNESQPGAARRSLYLQQRRTQMLSLLNLFDAPGITFNCVQRPTTTMPLQSLSQLNSEFALARAREFSARLDRESPADPRRRIRLAFEIAMGRLPEELELIGSLQFVETQTRVNEPAADASPRAWIDFCQMLLAASPFLYVE